MGTKGVASIPSEMVLNIYLSYLYHSINPGKTMGVNQDMQKISNYWDDVLGIKNSILS